MDEDAADGCGFLLAAALLGPLLATLAVLANRVLGVLWTPKGAWPAPGR